MGRRALKASQQTLTNQTEPAATTPPAAATRALARPFAALLFDWDGTAVVNRQEDARPLARELEALLRHRVWIIVVTGTNFPNIYRQIEPHIAPELRRHLLVGANRGSEVYGFDSRGRVVRRWLRVATAEEERALSAIAEGVRDLVSGETGLAIDIIYDRLNRRKIDLIPLPEWADPPKARIGELLTAVEARLQGAGLRGGLGEVVALTERLAGACGLPDARITSDVKHIEVGLTDKGDSMAWIKRAVLAANGIAMRDVLVAGDEFGTIAGFPGSDDRLRAGADEAPVVSVGKEPTGVPAGVIHLGGGPARFRALLAEQVRLREQHPGSTRARAKTRATARQAVPKQGPEFEAWARQALTPSPAPDWVIVQEGYEPKLEPSVEARFTVSNGYLGVRGSLELPAPPSMPRTYLAGLFDLLDREPPIPGLVPAPNWLPLDVTVNGQQPDPAEPPIVRRVLDLKRGLVVSEWRLPDRQGQTVQLRTLRLASQANRALGVQLAQLASEQELAVSLAPLLETSNLLDTLRQESRPTTRLYLAQTRHTHQPLAMATALAFDGPELETTPYSPDPRSWRRGSWRTGPAESATLSRLVILTARDAAKDTFALNLLRSARLRGMPRLLATHEHAWARRWEASDIWLAGDPGLQRALRFSLYHLNSAADPENESVSIGARGLTGDAYFGHVFWDTEIFLLPFYTLTWPEAARAMLMYRYHTLPAACAKARRLGYRGALYAWESADSGEEATPPFAIGLDGKTIPILCGTEEQHISADVAYAVWQHWQATGDEAFLLDAGAEILLETARFWASRSQREADGRYHIRRVIGPDEYHESVDDNAYTNVMAQWNLERGLEVIDLLQARWPERWPHLALKLALTTAELDQWREVCAHLAINRDPQTGVLEQFDGFFGLEPIDLKPYLPSKVPMDVVLGAERTRQAQVLKQADVVMLLALLWDRFTPAERAANFAYYEPRTGHGSSLSPAVHALVAARLGNLAMAEQFLRQAAAIDLDDTMGNAALGVHMATQGGVWQAVVLGFAGLSFDQDGLRFAPQVPAHWQTLQFRVQWQGRRVRVTIEPERALCTVALEKGRALTISVGSLTRTMATGTAWTCRYGGLPLDERDGAGSPPASMTENSGVRLQESEEGAE